MNEDFFNQIFFLRSFKKRFLKPGLTGYDDEKMNEDFKKKRQG